MDTSKQLSALLLICMLSISSFSPIITKVTCLPLFGGNNPTSEGGIPVLPPVVKPPPVTVVPPVITVPPVAGTVTCPVDTVKIGSCVDQLGGLVDVQLGDPAANVCCSVLEGLPEAEVAVCLCTTLKLKLCNLGMYVPICLKMLAVCGMTVPTDFSCT